MTNGFFVLFLLISSCAVEINNPTTVDDGKVGKVSIDMIAEDSQFEGQALQLSVSSIELVSEEGNETISLENTNLLVEGSLSDLNVVSEREIKTKKYTQMIIHLADLPKFRKNGENLASIPHKDNTTKSFSIDYEFSILENESTKIALSLDPSLTTKKDNGIRYFDPTLSPFRRSNLSILEVEAPEQSKFACAYKYKNDLKLSHEVSALKTPPKRSKEKPHFSNKSEIEKDLESTCFRSFSRTKITDNTATFKWLPFGNYEIRFFGDENLVTGDLDINHEKQ